MKHLKLTLKMVFKTCELICMMIGAIVGVGFITGAEIYESFVKFDYGLIFGLIVLFLMIGAILGGFGIYNYLIEWAGAGASLPITGFGNSLARGAMEGVKSDGLFGAIGGGLMATSAGVAVSIGLSYMMSFFVSSKSKKN